MGSRLELRTELPNHLIVWLIPQTGHPWKSTRTGGMRWNMMESGNVFIGIISGSVLKWWYLQIIEIGRYFVLSLETLAEDCGSPVSSETPVV